MTNLTGSNLNRREAAGPKGEGRDSPSTFTKYPEYKDSGVEWLGEVPAHWEVSRLKFFGQLITGITPPSEDLSNYTEAGWPWVRPDDLDDQGAPVQASKFLTDQGWSYCRPVASMSTLVCCIGSIGKLGYTTEVTCTNQQITAIQPFYNARYLFYLACASRPELDLCATGNVLRILNAERLGNVPAVMPSIDESAQIAAFLDHETARIDALVEEQQRLIELLKEKRQAVISHAVTKGLEPGVPMKDPGVSGLPLVPSHWQVINFGVTNKKTTLGGNYNSSEGADGAPIIKMGNISRGNAVLETVERLAADDFYEKEHKLKYGDFLFNTRNSLDLVGKVCVWKDELKEAAYNSNVLKIDFSSSLVSSSFYMNYLFNSSLMIGLLRTYAKGTTSVAAIYYKDLQSIPIPLPPKNEQAEIVRYLDSEIDKIDRLYFETKEIIAVIKERRSALISAAVTGKIDVRGWQPPEGSTAFTEATQTEMV